MSHDVPPAEYPATIRTICLAHTEAYEESAWTGTRWRVNGQTFAHVITITNAWPPAYARAANTDGPAHVLMFRSAGDELEALRHAGFPFFTTPWRFDEIGLQLTADTDWIELAELTTESYRAVAPKRLARVAVIPPPNAEPDRRA